jgi:protein-tyrosine phosphatase
MKTMGLDTSGHRSRRVTGEMMADFDLILTMEAGHKEALLVEFPELAGRIYMLSEMVGDRRDIADPIGGPLPHASSITCSARGFGESSLSQNKILAIIKTTIPRPNHRRTEFLGRFLQAESAKYAHFLFLYQWTRCAPA